MKIRIYKYLKGDVDAREAGYELDVKFMQSLEP